MLLNQIHIEVFEHHDAGVPLLQMHNHPHHIGDQSIAQVIDLLYRRHVFVGCSGRFALFHQEGIQVVLQGCAYRFAGVGSAVAKFEPFKVSALGAFKIIDRACRGAVARFRFRIGLGVAQLDEGGVIRRFAAPG